MLFLAQLKQPLVKQKILDTGCGPGHHSNFFSEQGCEVEGIDASYEMIRIANKNKTERSRFRVADMRDLQRIFNWFPRSSVGIHTEATSGSGMRSHARAWERESIQAVARDSPFGQ